MIRFFFLGLIGRARSVFPTDAAMLAYEAGRSLRHA